MPGSGHLEGEQSISPAPSLILSSLRLDPSGTKIIDFTTFYKGFGQFRGPLRALLGGPRWMDFHDFTAPQDN